MGKDFSKKKIANKNESIVEKTRTIQEDYIKSSQEVMEL